MIIQSNRVWIRDAFVPCQLHVEEGRIASVRPYGYMEPDADYGNKRIVPGFMDVHCHGYGGWDTNDATPDGLRNWTRHIPEEGVTSFCPTTITQSEEVLTKAVANVARVVEEGYEGADIVGIHLEGPYLDQFRKGAQPEQYCVKPSVEQFKHYEAASHDLIKLVTIAVEHDDDFALTHYMVDRGIVVSQGHSNATYEEAVMAIANGAMSMTHVYNGMSPFQHREPGLVGTAYRFPDVYGEIICDGHHSHFTSVYNFFMAKGRDHAVIITDSLMAKGLPAGTRMLFGGNLIELQEDGTARLVEAGNLAGSTLHVNRALENVVEKAGVPFGYAINACTINPARMLHLDDRKGSLTAGKDADIVVLDDNYAVIQTYCKGQAQL